jgi:hypothetical protein
LKGSQNQEYKCITIHTYFASNENLRPYILACNE